MFKTIVVLTTISMLIAGCNSDKAGNTDQENLTPEVYTLYSVKTELFVEFSPLIIGNISTFAAHFTLLGEKFLPLSEGTVTLSLLVGEKGIKTIADSPAQPGIFKLAIQPIVAGKGKLIFEIATTDYTDTIIIENVIVYANEQAALEADTNTIHNADITYLKEQAWKIEFANAPVMRRTIHSIIRTNGELLSAPGDETIITANASGIVLFTGNSSIIGSEVTKGMQLFAIAGGDMTVKNTDVVYNEAKLRYESAEKAFERATELVKEKIISEKEYQTTKLEFENAEIMYASIAKNYSTNGQKVTATKSGFVKNVFVSEGEYVESGTPLAIISQNKKLILQANVSQKYFSELPSITSANFLPAGSETVYNTENMEGKIISFGKSVNINSHFIPISFEIDNIGDLIPGSAAEIFLKSFPIADALVIPVSALLEEQGTFYVYVQTGGERFQKRDIKVGVNDGIHVQVLSGIQEGERIVTQGGFHIKLSTATGTIPTHGHEH